MIPEIFWDSRRKKRSTDSGNNTPTLFWIQLQQHRSSCFFRCLLQHPRSSRSLYIKQQRHSANQQRLFSGKTRVAPVKQHTKTKLELEDGIFRARLKNFIRRKQRVDDISSTHMWPDSTTALQWLQGSAKFCGSQRKFGKHPSESMETLLRTLKPSSSPLYTTNPQRQPAFATLALKKYSLKRLLDSLCSRTYWQDHEKLLQQPKTTGNWTTAGTCAPIRLQISGR